MKPELRSAVYAVAAAVLTLLGVLHVVDAAAAESWLAGLNAVLDFAGVAVALLAKKNVS